MCYMKVINFRGVTVTLLHSRPCPGHSLGFFVFCLFFSCLNNLLFYIDYFNGLLE